VTTADWTFTYTIDYTVALAPPMNGSAMISCPTEATDPGNPGPIVDACGRTVNAVLVGSVDTPNPLTCNGPRVWTYRYTACDGVTTADWTYTYTVNENIVPEITCPPSFTVAPDPGLCTTSVVYEGSATDNCDPDPAISTIFGPPSGGTFPVGVTSVVLQAEDACGNLSDPCSFTVTVTDPVVVNIGLDMADVCKLDMLALASLNAMILPNGLDGVWTTSGDGVFLAGNGVTPDNSFSGAVFYKPGPNDILNRSVLLTLQNSNPGGCPTKSDSVLVKVLNVGCGNFPWDGN
jgi:hypothetical protein